MVEFLTDRKQSGAILRAPPSVEHDPLGHFSGGLEKLGIVQQGQRTKGVFVRGRLAM